MLKHDVFYLTSEMKIQELKHRPSKPLKHMPKKLTYINI